MIDWKELSISEAATDFDEFYNTENFDCPNDFLELRNDLINLFQQSLNSIGINPTDISLGNNSYKVDLDFGLKLYPLLNKKYGMNIRVASNAGVWRFLSVKVIPDIVKERYGVNHPDRFWKKAKRLWLRVLWWYIHLSWQGDVSSTQNILQSNSTDEILQLVDRCGYGGYRVNLYREIMKYHGRLDVKERRRNKIFRKIMVLHTARSQVIDPELVDGGIQKYVSDLFDYFQ